MNAGLADCGGSEEGRQCSGLRGRAGAGNAKTGLYFPLFPHRGRQHLKSAGGNPVGVRIPPSAQGRLRVGTFTRSHVHTLARLHVGTLPRWLVRALPRLQAAPVHSTPMVQDAPRPAMRCLDPSSPQRLLLDHSLLLMARIRAQEHTVIAPAGHPGDPFIKSGRERGRSAVADGRVSRGCVGAVAHNALPTLPSRNTNA